MRTSGANAPRGGDGPNNSIYVAFSEAMLAWLKEYHMKMLIWTGKEKFTLAEHEEIVKRLEANDMDGSKTTILKHLERPGAMLRQVLPQLDRMAVGRVCELVDRFG